MSDASSKFFLYNVHDVYGEICIRHLCILSSEIILYWITLTMYSIYSQFLDFKSEFRDFKLWNQKLLFKGFVLEIFVEYF